MVTSLPGTVLSAAMSAKAISEQTGKEFLYKHINTSAAVQNRFRYATVTAETDWDRLTQEHQWLLTQVRLSRKFRITLTTTPTPHPHSTSDKSQGLITLRAQC